MEKVKFGIVGIGNMGSAHVNNVRNIKRAELAAVCDINPAAFDRIAPEVRSTIKCYTDLDQFLAEGGVDAVIVAVPHYSHPDIAIKALEAGKHIVVEKPIAVHKQEAERLISEARKYPELVKALMFNQRTIPAHKKIKQLIETGELGTIRRINWIITDWFRSQFYYDSGDWRASWRGEGGGVLLNQCPHNLDLWQWLFGMPKTMRATVKFGKYHDIEVEDEVNAYMEYEDGKVGNFIASTGEMPGTNRLEITAERGRLVFENGKLEFIRNEIPTSEFCKTTKKLFGISDNWKCSVNPGDAGFEFAKQHQTILENVTEAILDGKELISRMEEGINGLELGNSMLLSGLKNETVELPISSKEYAAELEKLIATSRYQKKAVVQASGEDFAKSFTK